MYVNEIQDYIVRNNFNDVENKPDALKPAMIHVQSQLKNHGEVDTVNGFNAGGWLFKVKNMLRKIYFNLTRKRKT